MAELARQNEATKNLVEELTLSRGKPPVDADVVDTREDEVAPEDVVLEDIVAKAQEEEEEEERAMLDPSRMPETLRQKLVLFELKQRNKKLEEELARKELILAAKRAYLAENYSMLAM